MNDLLSQVQAILYTTPSRWQTLTSVIPEELLMLAPAPGEWSALQCLQHLLDTEEKVFPVRVNAFLAGQNFPAFDPVNDGRKLPSKITPAALAAKFTTVRNTNLELLTKLKPQDLSRTAIHAELGKVTLGEMLQEWAGHDLMHLVQAERAMMQPFIAGCRPWQQYFKDHDVTVHPPVS
jgi:hypothetical protein